MNSPLWPTIANLVIAAAAVIVSIVAVLQMRRSRRSDVVHRLQLTADLINRLHIDFGGSTPYEIVLERSLDERERKKISLLFMHMQVMLTVFTNRGVLRKTTRDYYELWWRKTIRPWIESDTTLSEAFTAATKQPEVFSKSFQDWLVALS